MNVLGKVKCLVVDPPWKFKDSLPGPTRGASKQYPCLSVDELCDFFKHNSSVFNPELSHDKLQIAGDCYLFFWRVASMQPEAFHVIAAWGFTVKTELVWIKQTVKKKLHFGMGHHLRAAHEVCLVATRGKPKPLVRNIRTVFEAPVREHSRKPEEFYEIVEAFCSGPRAELFSRQRRRGWRSYGNEVNKFSGTTEDSDRTEVRPAEAAHE